MFQTVEFHTLGCKLNFAETSTLGRLLASRGIRRVEQGEAPDLCVVNTCSVTEMADKKGRQLIRRLAKTYPEATLVVTGCYAQLKSAEIAAIPGVDIVLGSDEKLSMVDWLDHWIAERTSCVAVTPHNEIKSFSPSCERGDRTRYFLKVQDGCDYFCTYCTIPLARGRSRSGYIADIVRQAQQAALQGGKEIVITGVNIGDFGRNTGERFIDLLKALDSVMGIERYRISSIEPNLLTPEIIRWCARESRAFMPHFHIPLQSGSDKVLKLMNRRYDTSLFADRLNMVTEEMPDAFIGVDIIAGARGETDDEWNKSLEFVKTLPFAHLHVFPYSERPNTAALHLGDAVSQEEKHRRVGMLTSLSEEREKTFIERFAGTIRPVLWEQPQSPHARQMHGLTDNYLRVTIPTDLSLVNNVTNVLLDQSNLKLRNE
ncbi:MAG: tRNA (N(6)-L-threonylcarbamoyladenosine(37)-C(2))-methylthiotransferase MtaB [Prevotella sp.]|nr:tRNA (N(6)-L-threonylcarbamoyladenosine(37)-C(2))-methylthiotransferase MtaB [Bacteroides sp.]MCM1366193.1 tRNA (N(6)-L-threonylcarbamoyladenosine(37)-C(2))-methylthiotransferase MtaB [Prevotella sp.]MCM1436945.1 tRNA (N(6)-L-threonylcarbamoyladenosine(37)-C(2))-methylthiotransferase MtaB [Prevotella sp.]